MSPVPRVHLVFDLCEEPHPRVDVPPGTVCDYDMEQGLLCQLPEGSTPVVMPPAHWLDASAAGIEHQQPTLTDEDNGTGYFAADDTTGASSHASSASTFAKAASAPMPAEEQLHAAPAPGSGHKGATAPHQHTVSGLHLPGGSAEVDAAAVFGTVGNGQASTWVTAAMHPQSTMQFA
jgi:hypothetical protein